MGIRQWVVHKLRSGLGSSKRDGRQLRVMNVQGVGSTRWNQLMIGKVHSAMPDNHRITITELFDELGLSFYLVQSILTEDLGMKCVSVKFVPKLLTVKQKENCLQ